MKGSYKPASNKMLKNLSIMKKAPLVWQLD